MAVASAGRHGDRLVDTRYYAAGATSTKPSTETPTDSPTEATARTATRTNPPPRPEIRHFRRESITDGSTDPEWRAAVQRGSASPHQTGPDNRRGARHAVRAGVAGRDPHAGGRDGGAVAVRVDPA
ncbi:hypothetical protein CSW53_27200 (plasmid) [Rhodococcus ruber]|nr:hypothetical protein CSW53_27200 [Rhodococcus ruber]